ncbi:T9SS type A sorting domain-containing protein [Bacteroidota bacterium]
MKLLKLSVLAAVLLFFSGQLIAQPNLSAPVNNSTWETTTPTLYWWYISTTGTENYHVQLSTSSSDFTTSGVVLVDVNVTGGGAASYPVPLSAGLTVGNDYYWRVGVMGNYSAVWKFTPSTGGGVGGPPSAYLLNITIVGSGSVTKIPNLLTYTPGTSVSLTAVPSAGWAFAGWSGDTTTTANPISVTMNGNKNITATFTPIPASLSLNINIIGNGSVTKSPDSTSYSFGTMVTLTAIPDTGWCFNGWSGDATGTTNPIVITMNSNKNITATFIQLNAPLLVSPPNGDTVSVHPALCWHPVLGATSYNLQVATDTGFASLNLSKTGLTDTCYHIQGAEVFGLDSTYYWRVSASNSCATGPFSTRWSFTTRDYPDAPELLSPFDGAINTSLLPILKWTSEYKATSYRLQISTNTSFTAIALDAAAINDTVYEVPIDSILSKSTIYYWRVRSNAPSGNSPYTSHWRFTTADFNIWYVRTDGNDSQHGLSPDSAKATIQAAVDAASPGDKIDVGPGTFTEDLSITTDNLDIYGTGYTATTTIKGITLGDSSAFVAAYPNIDIKAHGIKLHGFIIESPDVANNKYSSGVVFTGTNHEFYNNHFLSKATTTDTLVQGDGYCIVMQSWDSSNVAIKDISGLKIYNNVFSFTELSPAGGGIPAYEGIWINRHGGSGSIEIKNNTFSDNCYRAIAVQTGKSTVSDNSITTSIATPNRGIWILVGTDHSIKGNNISNFAKGMELGATWAGHLGNNISVTQNSITQCTTAGIVVSDDFSVTPPTVFPVINQNAIFNNALGIDVSSAVGTSSYSDLDAKNNWWGSLSGPNDSTFYDSGQNTGTSSELPGGYTASVKKWVNLVDESSSNPMGNYVMDNNSSDSSSGGLFVEYYPWLGSSPNSILSIDDASTVTGATFCVAVRLTSIGASFNTMQGKFAYDNSILQFVNATHGTGTLFNGSSWISVFDSSTAGIINFAGVGINPISNSGILFYLCFKVIAHTSGTTSITGNNINFFADGNNIFGTSGSFSNTITYTFQQYTYLRGDADLDGIVTLFDALLIDQFLNGSVSFTPLQIQNADADLSGGGTTATASDITTADITAILTYVLTLTWPPPSSSPVSSGNILFANAAVEDNGLLRLPVSIASAENVQSLELFVEYDESAIDFQSFKQYMLLSGNYVDAVKIDEGKARFAFVSSDEYNGLITPGEVIMKFTSGNQEGTVIRTTYRLNGGEMKTGPDYIIGVTDTEVEQPLPTDFEVNQNYPNPFNPSTTIRYSLPQASFVTVKIYNMLGQLVKSLISGDLSAGVHEVQWNGDDRYGMKVSSGTYIYRVVAGDKVATKKMVLLK